MAAPKGNQFWKMRSSHGAKPKFKNPEDLWSACQEYFEWVDAHPLTAAELVKYQGKYKTAKVPQMRAMTVKGLRIFLGISHDCWNRYRTRKGFQEVTALVSDIIYTQKFEGAAADLLSATLIARDLGLKDKKELSGELTNYNITVRFVDPDGERQS